MAVAMVASMTSANYVMPPLLLGTVPQFVCACDCDCGGEWIFCYADVFSHKLDRSPLSAVNEEDRARNNVYYYGAVVWIFRRAIYSTHCAGIVTISGDASHSRPSHNR